MKPEITRAAEQFSEGSRLPIANPPSGPADLEGTLVEVANVLLQNFTLIAGILAVFFLIFAGIKYIVSGGDAKRVQEARAQIIGVVIGVVIIVSTYYIVQLAVGVGNELVIPF